MKDLATSVLHKLRKYASENRVEIIFTDEISCSKKLQAMYDAGVDNFQVITDFDRTLSKYQNSQNPTCHGVFETDPELSPEAKHEYNGLRNYYYNIEIDPNKSNDEKVPYMIEWWSKGHDLIVQSRLHKSVLANTVKVSSLALRDGVSEFVKRLCDVHVPVLVFSAGIGNVIEEVLKNTDLLLDNVRIVSNFMNFDNDGIVASFTEPIIHTFNKTARSIQHSDHYEDICVRRHHVLLMGDSTGDPNMSDGLYDDGSTDSVIKIGFLNVDNDMNRERYLEIYDIVIVSDESFSVPQIIVDAFGSFSPSPSQ